MILVLNIFKIIHAFSKKNVNIKGLKYFAKAYSNLLDFEIEIRTNQLFSIFNRKMVSEAKNEVLTC